MKLLVFTDIHGDLSTLEKLKKEVREKHIELIICTGDYTFFENHIEYLTKRIAELGAEVLIIHGNHEYDDVMRVLCKKYKHMHFLHNKIKKIGNYTFIGHGGGGFSLKDPEFVEAMKSLTKDLDKKEKIVLITHAPAHGTKLDMVPGYGHVGNKDYRRFIETNNVVLALSGHIHESFGKEDKIGKARVINPGYKGKVVTLE